jgi:hypothetical protein
MKTSSVLILTTSLVVVGGLAALLLFQKKKPLEEYKPPTPPPPPPPTTPDPVTPAPVVPAVPQMSESEKYDKKIDGAAGMLYEALNGIDWSGAGEEQFWSVTRSLDKDEREDVADVYDDDWGNLCWDIEGDFSGADETRALKKYGYPSGNYVYSNC